MMLSVLLKRLSCVFVGKCYSPKLKKRARFGFAFRRVKWRGASLFSLNLTFAKTRPSDRIDISFLLMLKSGCSMLMHAWATLHIGQFSGDCSFSTAEHSLNDDPSHPSPLIHHNPLNPPHRHISSPLPQWCRTTEPAQKCSSSSPSNDVRCYKRRR